MLQGSSGDPRARASLSVRSPTLSQTAGPNRKGQRLSVGASVRMVGHLQESQGTKQTREFRVHSVEAVGQVQPVRFPPSLSRNIVNTGAILLIARTIPFRKKSTRMRFCANCLTSDHGLIEWPLCCAFGMPALVPCTLSSRCIH